MTILKRSSIRNRLLNSLSEDDFHALEPHLRPIALDLGRPVFRANAPLDNLIFPESGFASLTTDIDGSRVEIGLIGREGVTGISLTYGVDRVPFDCFVQSPGMAMKSTGVISKRFSTTGAPSSAFSCATARLSMSRPPRRLS